MKQRLVVNALNLSSRGGYSILADCIDALDLSLPDEWEAEAYVCSTEGLGNPLRVKLTVIPKRRNSWLDRIWFELKGLHDLQAGRKVDVFLSLQGASARLSSRHKAVYCHQNLPLAPMPMRVALAQPRIALQRFIYDALYRFGIGPEAVIIVQQQWTRDAFAKRYGLTKSIVARPTTSDAASSRWKKRSVGAGTLKLLYPAGPYPNKDIGVLCEAVRTLRRDGLDVIATITVSSDENSYTRKLAAAYADVPQIEFVGLMSRAALEDAYRSHDLLVFPSLVESWGLPLSEGKEHGIGILAADLPYAHEAVGTYDGVSFFPPGNAALLAQMIAEYWTGVSPLGHRVEVAALDPFARTWAELIRMLTSLDEIARTSW